MKSLKKRRLLLVDDDEALLTYFLEMLAEEGYEVECCLDPHQALEKIGREAFDLVISDVEMPAMRGVDLLKAIHQIRPDQLVILITAFGSIELAVQCVRAGGCDFLAKPFPIEVLFHAIERAFRERKLRREIVRLRRRLPQEDSKELVARSPAMQRVVEVARRAAQTASTVLITGESGTGKGLLARFIHDQSTRSRHTFVRINCAAIPPTLVEPELFGVRRGAYTDAKENRRGLFEEACGGTLFLDEIAEMPLELQPKLLQALETGKIRPVGDSREVALDVRVIAATNQSLEEALREKRFRPDLYYRLNVIRLDVPPLRQRREDLEALIDLLLDRSNRRLQRNISGISAEALRWILSYPWPGNVRELANLIERAVALSDHDTILPQDFLLAGDIPSRDDFLDQAVSRSLPLEEVEQVYIRKVLDATGGNKQQAARILGIDRRTLYRRIDAQARASR